MIQRIQSIYLFLAALCGALLYFFPMAEISTSNVSFFIHELRNNVDGSIARINYELIIFSFITIFMPLLALFSYKNRKLQVKLVAFAFAMTIIEVLVIYFYVGGMVVKTMYPTSEISFEWPFVLPLMSILFCSIAVKAIKKDDELVRSADRLR